MKTYSINVTNSYFSSTAKDELICISDGISGGWTETKINNCTLNGKAVTNYSSFLMVINSLYNTSYVKAEINNINFKGNCNNYGLVVGKDTINASCVDFVNSNLIFTLDNGGGVRTYGTDGREKFYINNSSINVNTSANAAYNISLNSCYCNSKVVGCNIYNCLIENLTGRACEDCRTIMNSIIKAGTQAIHSYGAFSCSVLNNKIYADSYGIHLQNNSTVGCNNCIVCNNFIQRLNNNDNSGSIGIYAPYCTNSSFSNNRTLVKTGATTGSSYGFNTWYSLTNASNTLIPENATVSYV